MDCCDGSVILLLIASCAVSIRFRMFRFLTPLILSGVIIAEALINIPFFVSMVGAKWLFVLWGPGLSLIIYSTYKKIKGMAIEHTGDYPPLIFVLAGHGIALAGFFSILLLIYQQVKSGQAIDWPRINAYGVVVLSFYLLFEIAPWRLLPIRSPKDIACILLLVAVGLFVLRGGMWCYGLFNASVKERPGSFRLKGLIYSEELASGWRFNRLKELTDQYWRYIVHPLMVKQEPPFVRNEAFLWDGLQKAEDFRQSLLVPDENGFTRAELIAMAIVEFKNSAEMLLEDHVSLKRFKFDAYDLLEQINGNEFEIDSKGAFDEFIGRWYGIWDKSPVNHHWRPLEYFEPVLTIPGENSMQLRMRQYCWIGDGFGWNAIASIPSAADANKTKENILGIVYHVKDKKVDSITGIRPHIGLVVGYGQLIWITDGEIFLEEVITYKNKSHNYYAITGFNYIIDNNTLMNNGDLFQAVYSRLAKNRTAFFKSNFKLSISVDAVPYN